MKTPDEIKNDLKRCPNKDCSLCLSSFHCDIESEALEYIQQLEHRIGELAANVAQLEKERSALLDDLRVADMTMCNHCAYYVTAGTHGKCDGYCWRCGREDCPCNTCVDNSNWKWRGVQEVEYVREF